MLLEAYHSAVMVGGVATTGDQPGQAVLDLTPGEWIAWGEDIAGPERVIFSVIGEMPADLPEPDTCWTACWMPDLSDGAPHAVHGMVHIIDVAR